MLPKQTRRSSTFKTAFSSLLHSNTTTSTDNTNENNKNNTDSTTVTSASLNNKTNSTTSPNRRYSTNSIGNNNNSQNSTHLNSTSSNNTTLFNAKQRRNSYNTETTDLNSTELYKNNSDNFNNLDELCSLQHPNDGNSLNFNISNNNNNSPIINSNNDYLLNYLKNKGFMHPKTVIRDNLKFNINLGTKNKNRAHIDTNYKPNDRFKLSIATAGDYVFIPTLSNYDDEYLLRLNGFIDNEDELFNDDLLQQLSDFNNSSVNNTTPNNGTENNLITSSTNNRTETENTDLSSNTNSNINSNNTQDNSLFRNSISSFPASSSNLLPDGIEIDNSMTSYNLAVILTVNEKTKLNSLNLQLTAKIKLFWQNGVPPNKVIDEEFYNLVHLNWSLNLENFNLFIPKFSNQMDSNNKNINKIVERNEILEKVKFVSLLPNLAKDNNYLDKKKLNLNFINDVYDNNIKPTNLEPGDYVFILPVIFTNNIPETLYYPSARVSYSLKVATILADTTESSSKTPVNINQKGMEIRSKSTKQDPGTHNPAHQTNSSRTKSATNPTLSSSPLASDPIENHKVSHKSNGKNPLRSDSTNSLVSENSFYSLTELEHINGKRSALSKNSLFKKVKNTLHINNTNGNNHNINGNINGKNLAHLKESNVFIGEYPLRVIRTPPPISISTANKPIYINRVWSNSLSYEISFAQKYVPLNSEVPIKLKLAPLEKNISIKRIKISINEKITFVSKDLKFEYDQVDPVAKDPYNPYYLDFQSKRRKERNLSLLEIRTKPKGGRAIREEIVENAYKDNLLSYNLPGDDANNKKKNKKNKKHDGDDDDDDEFIHITEPITIESVLYFPKYEDLDKKTAKIMPPYGIDAYQMVPNPELIYNQQHSDNMSILSGSSRRSSHVMNLIKSRSNSIDKDPEIKDKLSKLVDKRFHKTTFKTNSGYEVKHHTKLNEPKRGLYLDSLHFSQIHTRHKLEIMLRISKPDPENNGKLRHYEVLIDTPIFLVSQLCSSGNMELPTYHMAITDSGPALNKSMDILPEDGNTFNHSDNIKPFSDLEIPKFEPPSFEQAISVPNSPGLSPMGTPNVTASYDSDMLSIQQLTLSRATSISGPSSLHNIQNGSLLNIDGDNSMTNCMSNNATDDVTRFNNLDKLLATKDSRSTIFKKNFSLETRRKNSNGSNKSRDGIFDKEKTKSNDTILEDPINSSNNSNKNTHSDTETISDPPNYEEATN